MSCNYIVKLVCIRHAKSVFEKVQSASVWDVESWLWMKFARHWSLGSLQIFLFILMEVYILNGTVSDTDMTHIKNDQRTTTEGNRQSWLSSSGSFFSHQLIYLSLSLSLCSLSFCALSLSFSLSVLSETFSLTLSLSSLSFFYLVSFATFYKRVCIIFYFEISCTEKSNGKKFLCWGIRYESYNKKEMT